ncbi:MAG: hypothetical protein CVV27_12050, partial [Candidatus Melainabacteria bacterium HGW-Melainabacteria-1]
LVILLSYAFVWRLRRDGRRQSPSLAWSAVKWGHSFFLLSTLGPWSLGVLMARQMPRTIIDLVVHFYLHFLYNGFYTFALLGLLLHWRAMQGRESESPGLRLGLLAWACLPAYALSTLWAQPPAWVWWLAWMAAAVQVLALLGLSPVLIDSVRHLSLRSGWSRLLLGISLGSLGLKLLLQALSSMPMLAVLLHDTRSLMIGYLHLVFLGFVSCFLLAWLIEHGGLQPSAPALLLFMMGLLLSEATLLADGLWHVLLQSQLPGYRVLMLATSSLIPLGTLLLLLKQRSRMPLASATTST